MAPASVWTFAGGKGGAGRTLLAANLGIQLARGGRRGHQLGQAACSMPRSASRG
jgi:hypothetical protein